jgi:hypothetical protein
MIVLGVVLGTTALVASACGLPYDATPRALSEPLPSQLTRSSLVPPTTAPPLEGHGALVGFYYIQNSVLKDFPQTIPRPLTLAEVLVTLGGGPSIQDEGANGGGVSSDIPPTGSNLRALAIVKGIARIGLDQADLGLGTPQAVLELGQVVYTVVGTRALGVRAVQFYFNGSPVAVVNGNGQTVTGTVNETSYCVEVAGGCPLPPKKTDKKTG